MGCRIMKGVTEQCTARLRLTLKEIVICCAQEELVGLTLIVPIKVNELEISAVIDTAAKVTILSRTVFEKLKRKPCIVEEINLKGLNEDEPVKEQPINAKSIYYHKTTVCCILQLVSMQILSHTLLYN